MSSMHIPKRVAMVAMLDLLTMLGACSCPKPEGPSVDVADPACPEGTLASAQMMIHGELDGLRPLADDKQIRVRGTRSKDESACFAPDGALWFTVMLEGDATVDVSIPPLAHGQWELSVAPLSGGDHPEPPAMSHVFQPGVAYVIAVTSSPSGDLQVRVTP